MTLTFSLLFIGEWIVIRLKRPPRLLSITFGPFLIGDNRGIDCN